MTETLVRLRQTTMTPAGPSKASPIFVIDDYDDDAGDRKNPINVDDWQLRGGDQNHPISIMDEDDDCGVALVQILCDRDHPINVDHYDALQPIIVLDGFDPKGKRPIVEVGYPSFPPEFYCTIGTAKRAIVEVGEPSCPSEFYCTICTETKLSSESFSIASCSHSYCESCVSQYVAAKVEENQTSIGCPECKDGFLEPDMCRRILPPEVFDRWGGALCELLLESVKFYCPYKDCSALLIDDGEGFRESECPHCFRLFCARCKVPWHEGFTCEEYDALGPDRAREDLMLMQVAKNHKWQRCPKCKFFVERISGCLFMKCRCGTQFCYTCATETARDHYCAKCMPNFNLHPNGMPNFNLQPNGMPNLNLQLNGMPNIYLQRYMQP